jgi:hypothetical protein
MADRSQHRTTPLTRKYHALEEAARRLRVRRPLNRRLLRQFKDFFKEGMQRHNVFSKFSSKEFF